MKYLYILILLTMLVSCQEQKTETVWTVSSPSTGLAIRMKLDSGKLSYTVSRKQNSREVVLLEDSPLGLVAKNFDASLFSEAYADSVTVIDEKYTLTSGKQLANHSYANQLILHLKTKTGGMVEIHARAYNDGVAFRYGLKVDQPDEITEERTGFAVPSNGRAWIQPYDTVTMWTPAYEKFYAAGMAVGTTSPEENGWCFPALFEIGDQWMLISESNLNGRYVGSHLNAEAPKGLYTVRFPEAAEAKGMYGRGPALQGELTTPWRVIIVGDSPGKVAESNLVNHLADAPNGDYSWVKPGRASWSWWSDHASSQDFDKLKSFVDLAATMGWEYALVDANWNIMKGGSLEALAQYAKSKDIGLWVWYNSGGNHNDVTEQPRDRMIDPAVRKEEFRNLRKMGIAGIKVDFFQSDKQPIVQQYLDILSDAAASQIMVNFHGCTIPRGWQRTWPNLLSMESVRGAEAYSFARDYPADAARQNTILPFTRNVIGAMDYTPVTFTNQTYPHTTTWAHELALSIVFETGALHFADRASAYTSLPEDVKAYLRSLPTVWDSTRFLTGYPGKEVVVMRKRGDSWYVGAINGEKSEKKITIDFSFLPEGDFEATLIQDGIKGKSLWVGKIAVTSQSKQLMNLLAEGGLVVHIRPKI